MPFVPPSSLAPTTVTVLGVVSVSNFPADQLVHFVTPVDVTVGNFPALQPVSVDALPLPDGAASEETLSDVALTAILQRDRLVVSEGD